MLEKRIEALFLVVVDTFSRKNWVRAQKSMTAEETAKNLDSIFTSMPFKPNRFASDRGTEFSPSHPSIFKILVEKYGMVIFKLGGDHKASMAERFIRTLKTRIERFFTESGTFRWVDVLQKLSKAINNSENRSIGMAPNEVNDKNREKIFRKLYGKRSLPPICRFSKGDRVRLQSKKSVFDKGYKANWTDQIFVVEKVYNDGRVCFYGVRELDGSLLKRKYYTEELNLVSRNDVPNTEHEPNELSEE